MGTIFLIFVLFIEYSFSIHCDKELNYHEDYGYGFDIACEGLTKGNEAMLKDISVYNEISLRITNSNLTNISSNLFENVKRIRFLSFTNSSISRAENENPLQILEKLEHLTLDNTLFKDFDGSVFQKLLSLKELKVVNNNVSVVNTKALEKLENLETLVLSNNSIRDISQVPFCHLLKLKYLLLDRNLINQLPRDFLSCQKNISKTNQGLVNLKELDLSYNEIKSIGSFRGAFKLRFLNLRNNKIGDISENAFENLISLEKLNLRDNSITRLDEKALNYLTSLRTIDLENNELSDIRLNGLLQLENVYLSNNKITIDSVKNSNNLPRLKFLLLNKNNINRISDVVLNYSSLEVFDVSDNNLMFVNDLFFDKLRKLKQLSLKNTDLESISSDSFKNLKNLEFLDLSINKLTTINDPEIFSRLENLQVLNISYNILSHVDYNVLETLRNLQVLDIAGNRLENFQFQTISTLPSLRIINIKSNLLSCDILAKIISFLTSKRISFNINEDFQYDKKNIAGIYCDEMKSNKRGVVSAAWIVFGVVFSGVFFSFVVYNCLLYTKRRHYFTDEIELIED